MMQPHQCTTSISLPKPSSCAALTTSFSSYDLLEHRPPQLSHAAQTSDGRIPVLLLLQEPPSNAEHTRRADTVRLARGLPLRLRSVPELKLTQCPAHEGSRTRRCRSAQDQQHRTHDIHRRSIQDVANARNIVLSNRVKGAATSPALIGWPSSAA